MSTNKKTWSQVMAVVFGVASMLTGQLHAQLFVPGPPGITTNTVTGNVGIGTNTPGAALEVVGRGLFTEAVFTSSGANDGVYITHPAGEQGIGFFRSPHNGRADIRYDGSSLRLVTRDSTAVPYPDNGITITKGGQVGIGTATPNLAARITASIIGAAPTGFIQGIDLRVQNNGANVGINSLATNGNDNTSGVFHAWDGSSSNTGVDAWARGLGSGPATGGTFLAQSAATVTGTSAIAQGTSNPGSQAYGGKFDASNAAAVIGVDATATGGSSQTVGAKFVAQTSPSVTGALAMASANGQPSSWAMGGSFFSTNAENIVGVSVRADGTDVTRYNYGVDVVATSPNGNENFGVSSMADATNNVARNYGVRTQATNFTPGSTTINYGIYATYMGGAASTPFGAGSYAGYFAGNVFCTGSYFPSDACLKTDVNDLTNALEKISQLQPKTYHYKTEEYKYMNLREGENIGFMAQELEQVFPNMVRNTIQPAAVNSEGKAISDEVSFKAIDYVSLIPVLTAGIQEQQKQIAERDAKIRDLEQRLKRLEQSSLLAGGTVHQGAAGAMLYQNMPNPFSEATEIRYDLPENYTSAAILVFDMNGKQIKKVALQGSGAGNIRLSASELAAGMYLYSLVLNGEEIDTKRMIINQ